jgi:hypothetical protein
MGGGDHPAFLTTGCPCAVGNAISKAAPTTRTANITARGTAMKTGVKLLRCLDTANLPQ